MKMKKMDRKLKVIIVLICIALGIAVLFLAVSMPGQRKEQNVETADVTELKLVYAYQNAQWNSAIEKTVEQFEQEHPDIRIEYQIHYEDTVYENIINKLIARDELGDIVQLKTPQPYAKSGLLGHISRDVVKEVQSDSVYVENGRIYGIGMINSTSGIIYNKELFREVGISEPKTYDEFLKCCRRLAAHQITPIGVGGSDLWHMEFWVNHFFRTDILSRNRNWQNACRAGETSWTDAEVGIMFSHLQDLFAGGYVDANWLSTSDGQLPYMMSEGEVAMIYGGPWTCKEIQKLNPDMDLGWFYVPDEKGNTYVAENRDTFWTVTAECEEDTEKYEAAMEFLKFFYSDENYSNVRDSVTAFPTTEHYRGYDMDEFQKDVSAKYINSYDHITGFIGDADTPQGFEAQMLVVVQQMLEGSLSAEQAQQKCQELWLQCMDEEAGNAS